MDQHFSLDAVVHMNTLFPIHSSTDQHRLHYICDPCFPFYDLFYFRFMCIGVHLFAYMAYLCEGIGFPGTKVVSCHMGTGI